MKSVIVISSLNPEPLPANGENWLVIGPCCWGRSRSLAVALNNAAIERTGYVEGTYTARVVPPGDLTIFDDGSHSIDGWTKEEQQRAKDTTRLVAVTKGAAQKWTKEANALLAKHTKELKNGNSAGLEEWKAKP